ncbi:MAG: hypothetical protein H6606_04180 [Flavobacteriales bacterium]|nr:hypothetical protein [Flavobacteriales bacterium]
MDGSVAGSIFVVVTDRYCRLLDWTFAILTWVALIWRIGYFYSDGDHEEVLPQIFFQLGETQLANDFLISSIGGSWTVRSPFVLLLSVFGKDLLESAFLIFHIGLNVVSFFFMIRIARAAGTGRWSIFVPLIAVFALYAKSPGANDFYSPQLIAETFSMFFALWAIRDWFVEKHRSVGVLLMLAVLFHPINGFQVSILLLASWFIQNRRELHSSWKYWSGPLLLSLAYMMWLMSRSEGAGPSDAYFDLLIRFRNPHHYLPSAFPMEQITLSLLLAAVAFFTVQKERSFIRTWIVLTVVGAVFYVVFVEWGTNISMAKTQWFKSTIWFRLWLAIGVLRLLPAWPILKHRFILFTASFLTVFLLLNSMRSNEISSHKSIRTVKDLSLVDVGVQAAQILPRDALIVQPMDITGFQAYAKRGMFVNFKAILHYPDFLKKWFNRLELVYGPMDPQRSGFQQFRQAQAFYENFDAQKIKGWKEAGITHALTRTKQALPELKLLYRNAGFYLYAL